MEDVSRVQAVVPHCLMVLTEAASQRVEPYRLDMAIRVGLHRQVPAITFVGPVVPTITRTGHDLIARGGPAVLQSHAPIADLVVAITRAVDRDGGGRVQPLFYLMLSLRDLLAEGGTIAALLQRAREITGANIETERPRGDRVAAVEVVAQGQPELTLFARLTGDQAEDQARQLELQLVADAAGRMISEASRAEHLPMLSQSELLTELLAREDAQSEPLLRRARALGVPVDGWHVVTRLDVENLLSAVGGDEIAAYELRQDLVSRVMRELRGGPGSWHHARSRQDLLFIHTDRRDPGPLAAHAAGRAVDAALSRVLARSRATLVVRCGVGSMHAGPHGLRASAMESRASVARARLHGVVNRSVVFDAAGVRRGLIEWYASDAARESAKLLLAPLDRLDAQARSTTIRTLAAYLDANRSLAKAAEAVHVHRNAIAYRVKRALTLLQVNLDDPEQRLMLHLACRAELMSAGSQE